MKSINHDTQGKIWEEEHNKLYVLKQIDSNNPSSGVLRFRGWLKDKQHNIEGLKGIEMGCGEGRI